MFLKSNVPTLFIKNARHFVSTAKAIEKKVKVNNLEINCVRSGVGENAVLLLPGALGSSWTDFKPQIDKLPEKLPNYSIIAWDPPGYGRSIPPTREFPIDFLHNDAIVANNLMKQLGFQKYSLLGWSDGGITALILAAKFPNAVNKLIVWGSNAFIHPEELKIYESMRNVQMRANDFFFFDVFHFISIHFNSKGIRDVSKWSKRMREPMEQLYGVDQFPILWSNWVDAFIRIYHENNGNICRNELKEIVAPTLIVHGTKDPMIAAEHIPYLRKHIKQNE